MAEQDKVPDPLPLPEWPSREELQRAYPPIVQDDPHGMSAELREKWEARHRRAMQRHSADQEADVADDASGWKRFDVSQGVLRASSREDGPGQDKMEDREVMRNILRRLDEVVEILREIV